MEVFHSVGEKFDSLNSVGNGKVFFLRQLGEKNMAFYVVFEFFFFEAPSRDSQGPFFFPGTKPWGRQVFFDLCLFVCVVLEKP